LGPASLAGPLKGALESELARRVGARYWGPGRFRAALREALDEGTVRRLRGGEYAPARSAAERSSDPKLP